jgi:glycerophosphoryl diester phosphodiesterase
MKWNITAFPKIGAHTGCDGTPYNTMVSFHEGIRLGADVVEVDLRVMGDGTVVLLHDDSPLLRQYTFGELNRPELRSQIDPLYERYELVKLEDILAEAKRHPIKLNLDIKNDPTIEPVIELVKQFGSEEQVFITGNSSGITSRYPDIRVVWNTPTKLTPEEMGDYRLYMDKVCEFATAGSYYGLNMQYRTCRDELVKLAHERGLAVWVYTVNDEEAMRQMIQAGVDQMTTKQVAAFIGLRKSGNK